MKQHITKTQAPAQQLIGCDAVRSAVKRYSDWSADTMVAIARAESNCRMSATGDLRLQYKQNGRTYGYSIGAFQIRILPGREACDSRDLATNVECAHNIYRNQGLRAWTAYSNGNYERYII